MTGTRRGCPLTRSLTDNKQVRNQQPCFHFHQNFSCRLWGPDTGRNPSWFRHRAAELRLVCGLFTCSVNLLRLWKSPLTESGTASLLKWSCIFISFHTVGRSPQQHSGPLPGWAVRMRPEFPRLCWEMEAEAAIFAPDTRFLHSRWSNSSVRDWSSSGRWQKTSKWTKYTGNTACFLHQYESIQTPQLTL